MEWPARPPLEGGGGVSVYQFPPKKKETILKTKLKDRRPKSIEGVCYFFFLTTKRGFRFFMKREPNSLARDIGIDCVD